MKCKCLVIHSHTHRETHRHPRIVGVYF